MVGIQLKSKVGEKGQVVIPMPIREQLNIYPNIELVFDIDRDNIILKKKKKGLDVFEEFISVVKNKKALPKNIDWDNDYYSQFGQK